MTFTTRPTLQGTFGMVSSTHWLASQAAMGDPRTRRQRLRRGGHRRLRPARRRAAPERPGRRGAGHRGHRDRPATPRPVWTGSGPGRRHHRALPVARDGPHPRLRAARRRRAGRGRRLAAAAARPRHAGRCGRSWRPRSTTPTPATRWWPGSARHGRGRPVALRPSTGPRRPTLWLRGRPSRRAAGALFTNPAYARHPGPARRGRGRRPAATARPRSRPPGAPGAKASSPRRSTRSPAGRSGTPVERPHAGLVTGADLAASRRRWEEPATLDWHGHVVAQDRPVGSGPGAAADAGHCSTRLDDPARSTRRPRRASTPRPRRSSSPSPTARPGTATAPTCPLQGAAVPGVRARAGRPDRRPASVGPAARPPDGARAAARRPTSARPARRRRAGDATTGEPTVSRDGVTRGDTCHVDVVDRWGNIDLRHAQRRLAAELARPSRSWASRWAAGCRCSGWRRGCRPRWRRAAGRAPRSARPWSCRDGQPVLACGTPGGDQQDQWQLLFLLRHLVGGQRAAGGHRRAVVAHDELSRRRSTRGTSSPACWWSRTGSAKASSAGSTRRGHDGPRGRPVEPRPAVRGHPGPGDRGLSGRGEPARDAGLRVRPLSGLAHRLEVAPSAAVSTRASTCARAASSARRRRPTRSRRRAGCAPATSVAPVPSRPSRKTHCTWRYSASGDRRQPRVAADLRGSAGAARCSARRPGAGPRAPWPRGPGRAGPQLRHVRRPSPARPPAARPTFPGCSRTANMSSTVALPAGDDRSPTGQDHDEPLRLQRRAAPRGPGCGRRRSPRPAGPRSAAHRAGSRR